MRVYLDLTKYHSVKTIKDIRMYFTWVGEDDSEPAMVLMAAHRKSRPCIIPLSDAYLYDDPEYLLQASMAFSEGLGFQDSMSKTYQIATAINDHIDDLVRMPDRPSFGSKVVAEARMMDNSGRVVETEVHDDL